MKNVGFWQFGDRLFLDVYVPLLFASIVDVHIGYSHLDFCVDIYYMIYWSWFVLWDQNRCLDQPFDFV